MPPFWVSLVFLLEAGSAPAEARDARLATAALASPRPRECRGAADGTDGLWVRARAGDKERYCELLARGYARLVQTPSEALAAAQAALKIVGPLPAVRVLAGRAELRLTHNAAALEYFAKAEAEAPLAFVDPRALHDYARAAALAGNSGDALRLYRTLVSRAALFDDAREACVAQIEAAAQVLAYDRNGTDEALGYLAQSRRESLGLSAWISGLRLLALERSGRTERLADSSPLPRAASLDSPLAGVGGSAPLLPPGELDAIRAVLTEPVDPSQAREHWDLYLAHASADNAWLAATQKRLSAVPPAKGKNR